MLHPLSCTIHLSHQPLYHQHVYLHTQRHTAATYQPTTQHASRMRSANFDYIYHNNHSPRHYPSPISYHPIHHISPHHHHTPVRNTLSNTTRCLLCTYYSPDLLFLFFLFFFSALFLIFFFGVYARSVPSSIHIHPLAFSYRFRAAAHALCAHACLLLTATPIHLSRRPGCHRREL